jgi:hypothetical protein
MTAFTIRRVWEKESGKVKGRMKDEKEKRPRDSNPWA